MPYNKHTWANNEVITAAKLNNMENGIAESFDIEPTPSALVVNESCSRDEETFVETYALDKTWQEIYNAFLVGPVFIKRLRMALEYEDTYWIPDDPSEPKGSGHDEQANIVETIYDFLVVESVNAVIVDPDPSDYTVHPHSINDWTDAYAYSTDNVNGYPAYIIEPSPGGPV